MDYPDLGYFEQHDSQKDDVLKLIKGLTIYNIYEKIDNEFKKNVESVGCETCKEKLNNNTYEVNKLLELCKSVCNLILKNDIEHFSTGIPFYNSCLNMKFRLYEHVLNITESPYNIENFYKALTSIIENTDFIRKDCVITNFFLGKQEFRDYKYLYEFLSNFFDIKNKFSDVHNSNDKLYCKYIKEFFRFYNIIQKNLTRITKHKYNDIFDSIKTELIKNKQLIFIYEKCKYEKTPCTTDSNIYNDIPCLKDKDDIIKIPKAYSDENNGLNILFSAVIPSVSILTIFFIFYKFTPLGIFLRSTVLKKENIPSPINEEEYHPTYNTNFKITNCDRKIYNIQYK